MNGKPRGTFSVGTWPHEAVHPASSLAFLSEVIAHVFYTQRKGFPANRVPAQRQKKKKKKTKPLEEVNGIQ